jgi:hypothetical protein
MKASLGLVVALAVLCAGTMAFVTVAAPGTAPGVALIDPAGAICSASKD